MAGGPRFKAHMTKDHLVRLQAPGTCKIRRGCKVEVCTGPGRHMRGDFSNGPGRAGKKRTKFFNGWVWLQKKEDE